MVEDERVLIINELEITDIVFLSIDKNKSVSKTLNYIFMKYSDKYELFFANGGDQSNQTIPEISVCEKLGIRLIDGLGSKIQSSSWLLKRDNK